MCDLGIKKWKQQNKLDLKEWRRKGGADESTCDEEKKTEESKNKEKGGLLQYN